jgi:hypothetical protein
MRTLEHEGLTLTVRVIKWRLCSPFSMRYLVLLRSGSTPLISTCLTYQSCICQSCVTGLQLHFPELGDQFTKQEVLQVIRALPPDKALGLDDFSARFIQSTWEIIKPEIMSAFHTFWYLNVWNFQENNGVLLFLLPKTPDAAAIKDYQPISLIHIFGKLF